MKRYYLSPIIGTGAWGDAYRDVIADVPGVTRKALIKTDPDTGAPLVPWALVQVSTANHSRIISDKRNAVLPDVPLDVKLTAIQSATKAAMKNDFARFGIPTALIDNADGYRDAIRGIGSLLDPNFNENDFDAMAE